MAFDIFCDFDGTISTFDVTDFLLERFAAPGWEELEERWARGEIGSRECMARQVALLDCSREEFETALLEVTIDPGFSRFLQVARRLGANVTVVSDGMDRAIAFVLARHSIRNLPIMANRLVREGERRFRLEHPHAKAHCRAVSGTCKCAAATGRSNRTVLVGDGRSDFCGSGAVDLVLAKAALADHCEERLHPHLRFETFGELALVLPSALHLLADRDAAEQREVA